MSDILHKITINAPKATVYRALATVDGLAGWWTSTTGGSSAVGDTIVFRFNKHEVTMQVEALEPGDHVAWRCTVPNDEWTDTAVTYDLTEDAGRTTLVFGHRAWKQTSPLFAHCSMKWATFLLSLRDYVETGTGRPFPRDLPI